MTVTFRGEMSSNSGLFKGFVGLLPATTLARLDPPEKNTENTIREIVCRSIGSAFSEIYIYIYTHRRARIWQTGRFRITRKIIYRTERNARNKSYTTSDAASARKSAFNFLNGTTNIFPRIRVKRPIIRAYILYIHACIYVIRHLKAS